MGRRRRALAAAALGGIPILASLALVSQAGAHGSMAHLAHRLGTAQRAGPLAGRLTTPPPPPT